MQIIDLLEVSLHSLELPEKDYSRQLGTRLISETIQTICWKNNIEIEAEVPVGLRRQKKAAQNGIIDFLIKHNNMQYAIEIDSSNKKWSLEKLKYMAEQGHQAIWIRWRYPINMDIPSNIHLLNLIGE